MGCVPVTRGDFHVGGEPAARGGKLCVRACAGTAPSPAGAETRRVGDSAPLSGVVKFHGGDPPDRPPRGGHGGGDNRPRLTVDSVFFVGVRMGGVKTARKCCRGLPIHVKLWESDTS